MKNKKSIPVEQKVIIVYPVHVDGVGSEIKQKVQAKYPRALVKEVRIDKVATEAHEFGKRVNVVVRMPEVSISEAADAAACWEGCRVVHFKEDHIILL